MTFGPPASGRGWGTAQRAVPTRGRGRTDGGEIEGLRPRGVFAEQVSRIGRGLMRGGQSQQHWGMVGEDAQQGMCKLAEMTEGAGGVFAGPAGQKTEVNWSNLVVFFVSDK